MHFPDGINVYGSRSYRGICPVEDRELESFFAILEYQYPSLCTVACHVRNEGKRTRRQGARFKKQGMRKGAPDIFIPGSPAFICELKRKDHTRSKLEPTQEAYLLESRKLGAFVCIALGADAALEAVGKWRKYSIKLQHQLTNSQDIGRSL